MAHDAVITSLRTSALESTGSCLPRNFLRGVNAQIANVALRSIGGLSRGTRVESLHLVVGAAAFYNLYVKHCAEFLDACLRASDSSIKERLRGELRQYFNAFSFEARNIQMPILVVEISAKLGHRPFPVLQPHTPVLRLPEKHIAADRVAWYTLFVR